MKLSFFLHERRCNHQVQQTEFWTPHVVGEEKRQKLVISGTKLQDNDPKPCSCTRLITHHKPQQPSLSKLCCHGHHTSHPPSDSLTVDNSCQQLWAYLQPFWLCLYSSPPELVMGVSFLGRRSWLCSWGLMTQVWKHVEG